jgi:hypothetical protein
MARVVAVLILADKVEEVVIVSVECLMSCITNACHLSRSISRSFMDGHHSKSMQDGVRPSHMSTDPPVGRIDGVTLVLTPVFHSVHPVAILLMKKVHELGVEKTLSSITGADRHNLPILSLVLIPRSSNIFSIVISIIIRVSSGSQVGHLVPSLVPSLLLSHQCLADHLSSLLYSPPEVSTIIKTLAMSEVVAINVSGQRELHNTIRAISHKVTMA